MCKPDCEGRPDLGCAVGLDYCCKIYDVCSKELQKAQLLIRVSGSQRPDFIGKKMKAFDLFSQVYFTLVT